MATTEKRISEALTAEFDKQLREQEARIRALESQEYALRLTVRELEERIGTDLKPRLAFKEEYDRLRDRARKFADS